MFDLAPDHDLPKPALYSALAQASAALVNDERDKIANMANVAACIWQFVPDINWAGFYRVVSDELVLGPFMGKPACVRIPLGQGVCGTAAALGKAQIVPDISAFPGHIACDANSRSELVVPIVRGSTVLGVIDLDSASLGRFDEEDAAGIGLLAYILGEVL